MNLRVLPQEFVVCKAPDFSQVNFEAPFLFLGKTDEEFSVVCEQRHMPGNVLFWEKGFKAIGIMGQLDFSMTGVIAGITAVLARADIGVFVVSTFNTDYVLVKTEQAARGIMALSAEGYTFF